MLAQVARVFYSNDILPARATEDGYVSQIFLYMIRAPFPLHKKPSWSTFNRKP